MNDLLLAAADVSGPDLRGSVLAIVLLPLATALFLLFFGKRLHAVPSLGRFQFTGFVAVVALAGAFVASALLFWDVLDIPMAEAAGGHGENARSISVHVYDWIRVGNLDIGVDFLVDQLSVVMCLIVTGVGLLITLYSISYMKGDERFARYFAYLLLFAASMLVLVLADNLLLMYVGWEGVGLCSYLLIGFWFERPAAANAAKKAFIVNRIGDFSFLLGILLLVGTLGTLAVSGVNAAAENGLLTGGLATVAALLLMGGAAGKSAQIPLYVWLPDAMEGPTPASALIHAATMVTAGVYMVARFGAVFGASSGDVALTVVAWTGALTALWAALMAATQFDIKRVLAYSTVSQLGYMFLANGVGAYSAGIFHLTTHAFFKALMFLGAGSVMHALGGTTDMRKMGGLRQVMPVTGWTFMMGWLAICGIFPFAGFFSKDAILAAAWADGEYALWGMGVLTALLTAFYMSRLYLRVFEGPTRYPEGEHPHEGPWTMTVPLVVLAVFSVGAGLLNLPGNLAFEHFLEPALGHFEVPHGLTAFLLAGLALAVGFIGIGTAHSVYLTPGGERLRSRIRPDGFVGRAVGLARNKFWVDEVYGDLVVMPGKHLAYFSAYTIDAKGFDGIVNGSGKFVGFLSETFRKVQTGYIRTYGLVFLAGVVVVVGLMIGRGT
jgi:NADH-quinone oxidoreductase subunit L